MTGLEPDDWNNWFFIVGCQRSGTTLMRLVLECHSQIECYDEFIGYKVLAGGPSPVRQRQLLGLKIPCLTEQLLGPVFYDRVVMPEMPNGYRGQKLLFLLRDVRDVVKSMLQLQVKGLPWFDIYCIPAFRDAMLRNPGLSNRYASDLKRLDHTRHRRIAKAAMYWRYKVDSLFDYLEAGYPVLAMRYEDLVVRPAEELPKVCQFLNVRWEPSLLLHGKLAHRELAENGLATGNTDPTRMIDSGSVGKWRDTFTREEIDEILAFAGDAQTRLYPETICC